MPIKSLIILIMVFNGVISAGGQLCFKFGVNERNLIIIFLGLICYGVSLLIWLFVLSKVDLSFAYALVALTYIFLLIFSKVFLHETLSPVRIFGSLLIILGIVFVAKS
ncbi:MAG: EamA family transporter [bacterium]|nr:EamA family transporter [bacterium]